MKPLSLEEQILATWGRHNEILLLLRALRGETAPRYFGKQPVRWLGYLIAHESHHRGQIALALKQSGMRLPEEVAVDGLWGRWIFGA